MNRRSFLIGGVALAGVALAEKQTAKVQHTIKKNVTPARAVVENPIELPVQPIVHKHTPHKTRKAWPAYGHRKPGRVKLSSYDHAVLVKTIWGETRGESKLGRMAVVHVILNRIHTTNPIYKSYKNIAQVCLKKYQFSCWLDKLTMRHIKVDSTFKGVKADVDAAIRAYEHGIDYSNGALLYYSDIIDPPKWASAYTQVNKIGLHNFFA